MSVTRDNKKFYDKKEIAKKLNLQENTVQHRLLDGDIQGVKLVVGNLYKWYASQEAIDAYDKRRKQRNKGGKAFIGYIPKNKEQEAVDALKKLGIDFNPRYTPKKK